MPGVVYANSFETEKDVSSQVFPDGRFQESGGGLDDTVSASGFGSIKFVVPSRSGAGTSGSWRINFGKPSDAAKAGGAKDLFIQWRQRFDPALLDTKFTDSGGFKQIIVGESDFDDSSETGSCSDTEIVVQNTYQRGFPQMYHSCGIYMPFEEPFGSTDLKMQNAMPRPYCLYGNNASRRSNCFRYVADEWMTFQLRVATGESGSAVSNLSGEIESGYIDSIVQLWVAREGAGVCIGA